MLSYKQFKALNESVMPSFTLGVANPANLGLSSPFAAFQEAKKMAKKKAKKKMIGDEEETGDGEMVMPSSEKDEPDVDVDTGEDMGDEDMGGCDKCTKMSRKKSKKKMWSDEDDAAPEEEDMGDEEEVPEDDEEMEDEEAPVEDEEEDDESGEELAGKGSMGTAGPMFSKKSKKKCGADMGDEGGKEMPDENELQFSKKKSKKNLKKEETEEDKWWSSVKSMVTSNPNEKFSDGWTEYQSAEFKPIDTENLTQAVRPEPQAGEVGFAPQQMGSFFS